MAELVVALDPVNRVAFLPAGQPSTVLWWVDEGERPEVEEALRRLRYLRAHGPSPQAFTLRRRFEPGGRPATGRRLSRR
jgi:hypothetical protein